MANPYHHAVSSARKWGGQPEDYQALHDFFDESKAHMADFRHRALRHHSEGIFALEAKFGKTITNSSGRIVPTRWIGEQHVKEDLGFIPTLKDWFQHIQPQQWMHRTPVVLEKQLELQSDPIVITDRVPEGHEGFTGEVT